MCGRYRLKRTWQEIHDLYRLTDSPALNLEARRNIAPTQRVPIVRRGFNGGRLLSMVRWGLVPSFADDMKFAAKCVNARAETVDTKPSFRRAFAGGRRCLVIADGYYEWTGDAKTRLPWIFQIGDGELMAFAGLWESWLSPEKESVETCAMITTEPNETVARVHDRMPAILAPGEWDVWLDPATPAAELKALLDPFPPDRMTAVRVSTRVNSSRNEGEDLDAPLEAA